MRKKKRENCAGKPFFENRCLRSLFSKWKWVLVSGVEFGKCNGWTNSERFQWALCEQKWSINTHTFVGKSGVRAGSCALAVDLLCLSRHTVRNKNANVGAHDFVCCFAGSQQPVHTVIRVFRCVGMGTCNPHKLKRNSTLLRCLGRQLAWVFVKVGERRSKSETETKAHQTQTRCKFRLGLFEVEKSKKAPKMRGGGNYC